MRTYKYGALVRYLSALVMIVSGAASTFVAAADQAPKQAAGYLQRKAPVVLRFAPPSGSPFISLPPLPITKDPQPTGEFDNPAAEAMANSRPPAGPGPHVILVPVGATNISQGAPITLDPAILQVLKFYPNGKPAGVELIGNNVIPFVPPTVKKPSSASYEVK
jgi:hypothetical protein